MRMIPVGNSPKWGRLSSPAVDPDVETTVATRLRHLGQRFTAGRRALVEALTKADRPVTIEEILRVEPRLPLSSTYRNLAILQQAGVVHRVSTDHEFARFELAEDLTDRHHHHLVCESCGKVRDLYADFRRLTVPAAARQGFTVGSAEVVFRGQCEACATSAPHH